jgi:putative oxidoreductase
MATTQAVQAPGSTARAVTMAQWGIFVVRVVLGVIFIMHGAQKVFGVLGGHPLAETASFMNAKMAIPLPLAYLSILTEFLGGIALIVGLLSRIAGIGLFINMIVAIAVVHFKNGFFMPTGYEFGVALLGMSSAIVLAGPGTLYISDWEGRFLHRRSA